MRKVCILDTDIGRDIDDSWALLMSLKRPELDLQLVTASTGDTRRRAKIVHRMLKAAHRDDIPIAAGKPVNCGNELRQYELTSLVDAPQEIPDAAEAIRNLVMQYAPEPVTLIGIAPMTNIAEVAARFPEILQYIDLVLMAGSLAFGVGERGKIAEWNIKCDIPAAKKVFASAWRSATITPLDSCAKVILKGNWLDKLSNHSDEAVRELGKHYLAWLHIYDCDGTRPLDNTPIPFERTSALFDTVAVYLAYSEEYLTMENRSIVIDDCGFMHDSPSGLPCRMATGWRDMDKFCQYLEDTIIN